MKFSSKLGMLVYGLVSMILLPFLLIWLNDKIHFPIFRTQLTEVTGLIFIGFGGILGLYSARIFAINGKGGSPLPIDPPKQLITTGIYKWIRNPMFVASGLVWFGGFLFFGSVLLFFYATAWVLFNHIHLVIQDEKW